MKIILAILLTLICQAAHANQVYDIYANNGVYLGNTGSRYDMNSINNPYGKYGSQYSPSSIHNNYGQYGSQYSPTSPSNQYVQPPIFVPQGQYVNPYMRY